mmetsp:Transcript_18896/g.26001  ORF Transcript_18896/g.26001 Transcript_18896/m.26001 type:complete len:221 (-) Transcript_18896:137-799(-)|eukprot:CAMPEP_0185740480 /NCGR_PEP_ID=MMETSP1171-20130828/37892_1 /TAXON_ID=374046 /ORGANISM="Helicotheca tamensis, Strain CCMP826" /LENGTH=220 /DNA_ID=CAMNT_0028412339 /DNA_START=28 /DNA_END=690 /DNA_ORIENTATION=+
MIDEGIATNTIMMASYFVVLTICFILPCLYSMRQHFSGNRNPLSEFRIVMRNGRAEIHRDNQGEAGNQVEDIEEQRISTQKLEEEKKTQILKHFKDVRMTMKESHFIEADTVQPDSSPVLEGVKNGEIHFPVPDRGNKSSAMRQIRVSDSCAICLAKYSPGDTIIYSSNPKCSHAFHEGCILIWLSKLKNDLLCPCCRSNFVTSDMENSTGETSNAGDSL